MVLQQAFFSNAIQGLILSLAFAFSVLIVTTQNIVVAFFSVLTIGCLLASVISIIQIMNWQLGISESLGIDLFVGFSVDYIVHVSHQYVDSIYDTRTKRMDDTFQNIGMAVFSGAVTTFSSATFLLFARIYVLRKFGILIELTIVFSILFSLVLLPALFYLMGPQYKFGDLKYWMWDPVIRRFRRCIGKVEPRKGEESKDKGEKEIRDKGKEEEEEEDLGDEEDYEDVEEEGNHG